jgi:bacterioferritin-associated ferredoxin
MIVCLCRAVSDTTIRRCIEAGATTPRQLGEMCGAGRECGACAASLEELVVCARAGGGRGVESPYLTAAGAAR